MKTIELENQQDWIIILDDEHEKTQYVFTDEVYSKLESIIVSSDFALNYPLLEGTHLNAPNLKMLGLIGKGCYSTFQFLNKNGISAPVLQKIYFDSIGITQFPEFILNTSTMKDITLRHEKIPVIPPALFNLISLQSLQFQYDSTIKIIPEEIKNLINLEVFALWGSHLDYVSPNLFLLPKICSINFAYSFYRPTNEVLKALEVFKRKAPNDFSKWHVY